MAAEKKARAPKAPRPAKPKPKKVLCPCCGREIYSSYDQHPSLLCGNCSTNREGYAQAAAGALTALYDEAITPTLAGLIADEAFTIADAMLRRARGPYAYADDAPEPRPGHVGPDIEDDEDDSTSEVE